MPCAPGAGVGCTGDLPSVAVALLKTHVHLLLCCCCAALLIPPTCPPTHAQALYARHGFVHVADKPLGDEEGAPVLKVMVRAPSSAAVGAGAEAQGAVEQATAAAGQADSVETD